MINEKYVEQGLMGSIRISRLYNFETIKSVDSLILRSLNLAKKSKDGQGRFPAIKCMTMSNEEKNINIVLETGDLITLDIYKLKVNQKLIDFGF